jgi:hypothetical protein
MSDLAIVVASNTTKLWLALTREQQQEIAAVNNAYFRAMPAQLERLAREGGPLVPSGMHGNEKAYRPAPGVSFEEEAVASAMWRIREREAARAGAAPAPAPAAPGTRTLVRSALLPPASAMPSASAATAISRAVDRDIVRVCAEAPLHVEDIADAIGISRPVVVRHAQALVESGRLIRADHRYSTPTDA